MRPAPRDDKFEIVGSSAYRLRQSRCFIASKEALTCDTCHDPHRAAGAAEAVRHYSDSLPPVPRRCFRWAGLKGDASRRHRVRRLPYAEAKDRGRRSRRHDGPLDPTQATVPRPAGRTRRTSPHRGRGISRRGGSLLPATLPRAGPDALYRALAQVLMKNNLRAGVAELSRLIALQQPREAEWYIQLGDAWLAGGDPPSKRSRRMSGRSG